MGGEMARQHSVSLHRRFAAGLRIAGDCCGSAHVLDQVRCFYLLAADILLDPVRGWASSTSGADSLGGAPVHRARSRHLKLELGADHLGLALLHQASVELEQNSPAR